MKTIAEQLIKLNQIKSNIKQAIISKGVSVSDSDGFATYPDKISAISGGGGSVIAFSDDIRFAGSTFSSLPEMIQNADWSQRTNMFYCFSGCQYLERISLPGISGVTNLGYCFSGCHSLTSVDLSSATSISNMGGCFYLCGELCDIHFPVLSYNTSLYRTFSGCSGLQSITLSGLSAVTSLEECFRGCRSLTTVNLSSLNGARSLSGCFSSCTRLESITVSGLSNVTSMHSCFYGCSALTSITISGLSNVTEFRNCFNGCTKLQNLVVDSWGTSVLILSLWGISQCTALTHDSLVNLINALYTTNVTRTCTIGTTNLAKLSSDEIAIATNKGWTLN